MNLNQYSIAAAQPGLAVEHVLNLWLPVPPEKEQSSIAKYIKHETLNIVKVFERTHREIVLLNEYRTRLISDVVTGKFDVRGIDLPATAMPSARRIQRPLGQRSSNGRRRTPGGNPGGERLT